MNVIRSHYNLLLYHEMPHDVQSVMPVAILPHVPFFPLTSQCNAVLLRRHAISERIPRLGEVGRTVRGTAKSGVQL